MRISGERGPFRKSFVKISLKTAFYTPNLHFGHARPDSTREEVLREHIHEVIGSFWGQPAPFPHFATEYALAASGFTRSMTTAQSFPLRGLRVLDLSRVLAGPWCTMLLGDAGASVVKIEKPGAGDDTRSWGPPFLPPGSGPKAARRGGAISTYFLSVNRSKRSAAVDLKRDEGRDVCRRLATEWADVVVENFRVGGLRPLPISEVGRSPQRDRPSLIFLGNDVGTEIMRP